MAENPNQPQLGDDQEALRAFYSHTSRVWNSAVTLTLAGAAFSATVMLSELFRSIPYFFRFIIGISLYLGVCYGFLRIVEIGVQLQFLERQIRLGRATSLLGYINQNIPRIRHRRLNDEQAERLRGRGLSLSLPVLDLAPNRVSFSEFGSPK